MNTVSIMRRPTAKGDIFHLRWIDPVGHCRKTKRIGLSRKQAERAAGRLEKELSDGTYTSVKRITWQAFADDHVSKLAGDGNRTNAEQVLREFGLACGVRRPDLVSYSDIEKYNAYLRGKQNRAATRQTKMKSLKAAFRQAVKRNHIAKNPMDEWKSDAPDDSDVREISLAEELALLDAATDLYGSQWHTYIAMALQTGCRRGEMLSLRWENVSLDRADVLLLHTKAKRNRTVPLTSAIVDGLRRLKARTLADGGPFLSMSKTDGRAAYKQFVHIRRQAGCEDVTIHSMRATCATRLGRAGVSLAIAQRLLGHSSPVITAKYYTHIAPDDLRNAVQRIA